MTTLNLGIWFAGFCGCTGSAEETGTEDPGSGEIHALTYNVHGLPPAITGDDTTGRMTQIAPLLEPVLLVGIQEDFTREGHEAILEAVTHPTQFWFDSRLEGRFYGSGLTFLSRVEAMEYQEIHYSTCSGVLDGANDCLASKGFQRMRLQLGPSAQVDVYNTHMDAGSGEDDALARTVQVQDLLNVIHEESSDRAVIVMGDFNLSNSDPEDYVLVRQLMESGNLQDSCDAVRCAEPGRIDRVFFRSGTDVKLEAKEWGVATQFVDSEGEMLSDHNAIGACLNWARVEPE